MAEHLTAQEERDLVLVAQGSDKRAADRSIEQLLKAFSGLIHRLAREAEKQGCDRDDAVQTVQIAALHAIRTHDPARGRLGHRIATKARPEITKIKVAVPTVRTSYGARAKKRQVAWLRAQDAFIKEHQRSPYPHEREFILDGLGIDYAEADAWLTVRNSVQLDHLPDGAAHSCLRTEAAQGERAQECFDIERMRACLAMIRHWRESKIDRLVIDFLMGPTPITVKELCSLHGLSKDAVQAAQRSIFLELQEEMCVGMESTQPSPKSHYSSTMDGPAPVDLWLSDRVQLALPGFEAWVDG